jgi:hypothetical protein
MPAKEDVMTARVDEKEGIVEEVRRKYGQIARKAS